MFHVKHYTILDYINNLKQKTKQVKVLNSLMITHQQLFHVKQFVVNAYNSFSNKNSL